MYSNSDSDYEVENQYSDDDDELLIFRYRYEDPPGLLSDEDAIYLLFEYAIKNGCCDASRVFDIYWDIRGELEVAIMIAANSCLRFGLPIPMAFMDTLLYPVVKDCKNYDPSVIPSQLFEEMGFEEAFIAAYENGLVPSWNSSPDEAVPYDQCPDLPKLPKDFGLYYVRTWM